MNIITANQQFPNTIIGSDLVTIQVIDSDIDDVDEAKGEPDVNVNGKQIRMIQGEDGNWYGYFAEKNAAMIADIDGEIEDQGIDFGVFCSSSTPNTVLGVDFDSSGIAVPRSGGLSGFTNGNNTLNPCSGSLTNSEILNNNVFDLIPINTHPNISPGQIGLDPLAWPLIQLYPMTDSGYFFIQYNKGGSAQTAVLTYSDKIPNSISQGGGNQWDTRPTFGLSHEDNTRLLVENGFSFNEEYFTVTDNHHTNFEEHSVEIGTINSFSATVFADKKLKVQEFLFGIPHVGESHLAELGVEVWYNMNGGIENVVVVQQSKVIDSNIINATHQKTKCLSTDLEPLCDTTTVSMKFLEPLTDKVMAIKAIDFKLRDQRTYLNDGFDISGDSINPMKTKMIPSQLKNQGLIKVTQLEKYSPYWQSNDGRMFEMNHFGSFKEINHSFERFVDTGDARTRMHSGFETILEHEQNRATQVFDANEIISELPNSFGYHFDITKRFNDELSKEMIEQQAIAKEILKEMDKQQRDY
jgi:hypothetical protein